VVSLTYALLRCNKEDSLTVKYVATCYTANILMRYFYYRAADISAGTFCAQHLMPAYEQWDAAVVRNDYHLF
jgi:hypothetical protein